MRSANLRAILIGMVVAAVPLPALAYENFDQGKSPQQLFASDCGACHNTAAGLAAAMDRRALTSFLIEHYTASKDIAATLAGYLAAAPAGKEAPIARRPAHKRAHSAAPDVAPDEDSAKARAPATRRHTAKPKTGVAPADRGSRKPKAGDPGPESTGSIIKPEISSKPASGD